MRIQYRWCDNESYAFTEWKNWDSSGIEDFRGCEDVALDIQTRIVDNEGNEVPQTEPFVPAFYQDITAREPRLEWFTTAPKNNVAWKRRDDVKPSARP